MAHSLQIHCLGNFGPEPLLIGPGLQNPSPTLIFIYLLTNNLPKITNITWNA